MYPNAFDVKLLHNFTVVKSSLKIWSTYVHVGNLQKSTQSKQSPNRRKFAQSGHPAAEPRLPGISPLLM
jgi:hypothetical protein